MRACVGTTYGRENNIYHLFSIQFYVKQDRKNINNPVA